LIESKGELSKSRFLLKRHRAEPLANFGDMRAGINPAPTVLFVGEGFIPSLLDYGSRTVSDGLSASNIRSSKTAAKGILFENCTPPPSTPE